MRTIGEIRAAIDFGKKVIEDYKTRGEEVPGWVYERMMQLYEELAENLSSETKYGVK